MKFTIPFNRLRTSSLGKNALALYGAHLGGLILPLLAIPFLARVLRPEGWGVVVFAQAFAAGLTLIIDYGFYLSATREISRRRDDRYQVAQVVADVQAAKVILLLVVTGLAAAAYLLVPLFRQYPAHLFWAWFLAVSQGLSAYWYFQGMERMARPALAEAISKGIATGLLFIWIRDPGDGAMVLAIYAAAAFGWAGVTTWWIYREVPLLRLSLYRGARMLWSTSRLFMVRISSGFLATSNSFVLGALAGPQLVAFFGGAERVVRGAMNLIHPATLVVYPRASHLVLNDRPQASRLLGMSLLLVGGLGCLIGMTIHYSAPLLIGVFLGPGYEAAIPVLKALGILPPIVAINTVLGLQWALPAGLERPYLYIMLSGLALNLTLAVLLVPRFGAMGMASAVIVAEFFVAAWLVILAFRFGRDLWANALRGLLRWDVASVPIPPR